MNSRNIIHAKYVLINYPWTIIHAKFWKNVFLQNYISSKTKKIVIRKIISARKLVDDLAVNDYYYFDKSRKSVELSTDCPEFCDLEYQMMVFCHLEYKMMLNQVTTVWLSRGTAIKPILHGYDGLKSYFFPRKVPYPFQKKNSKMWSPNGESKMDLPNTLNKKKTKKRHNH